MEVPISGDNGFDQVVVGVATQGSTPAPKRRRAQVATDVATQEETQGTITRSSKAKTSKKSYVPSSASTRVTRSKSTVKEAPSASKTSSRLTRGASKVTVSPSYPWFDAKKAKYDNFFSNESLAMWDYVCKRDPFLLSVSLMNSLILSLAWLIFGKNINILGSILC